MKKITFLWIGLLLATAFSARADVLDNWTTNELSTNYWGFHHVVYDNGLYVIVGEESDGGVIYSSPDGFNWTLRFSDVDSWGLTLNYSQGHFAGIGGFGFVDVSTNGTDWTSSQLPDSLFDVLGGLREITYGNGVYVTVGEGNGTGNILISPDGINWTSAQINPAPGGRIASVAYGSGRFVAVGDGDGLAYVSSGPSAGTNWVVKNIPTGAQQVSYVNGLFIVPLTVNSNLVSTDGIIWNMQNTGLTNQLTTVIYAGGLFLGRAGNYLATSLNGQDWVQYAAPIPGDSFESANLASDGTRLVTVSSQSPGGGFQYDGFVYTSDTLADVRAVPSSSPTIALSGLIGRYYQIESTASLPVGPNGWQTNLTLQLTQTPYYWSDPATTNAAQFYRLALLP